MNKSEDGGSRRSALHALQVISFVEFSPEQEAELLKDLGIGAAFWDRSDLHPLDEPNTHVSGIVYETIDDDTIMLDGSYLLTRQSFPDGDRGSLALLKDEFYSFEEIGSKVEALVKDTHSRGLCHLPLEKDNLLFQRPSRRLLWLDSSGTALWNPKGAANDLKALPRFIEELRAEACTGKPLTE